MTKKLKVIHTDLGIRRLPETKEFRVYFHETLSDGSQRYNEDKAAYIDYEYPEDALGTLMAEYRGYKKRGASVSVVKGPLVKNLMRRRQG